MKTSIDAPWLERLADGTSGLESMPPTGRAPGPVQHDTQKMQRADIEAAFEAQRRDTLPLPIALEIAESQLLDATLCPGCGCGIVPQTVADRIALAIAIDPDEPEPITQVETT